MKIREFPNASYDEISRMMREFTDTRDENTPDELWIVEHSPVYTLGQASKPEHILNPGNIPVIQTDRGGQVTYHGPGQLVVYLLVDIRRKKMGVRGFVCAIENSIIDLLKNYHITAQSKREAPGVYVGDDKICSIGLRIRKGCSYHGLAFNVNMDLTPFLGINPCGYAGLKMIQMKDFGVNKTPFEVAPMLIDILTTQLQSLPSQNQTCSPHILDTAN